MHYADEDRKSATGAIKTLALGMQVRPPDGLWAIMIYGARPKASIRISNQECELPIIKHPVHAL